MAQTVDIHTHHTDPKAICLTSVRLGIDRMPTQQPYSIGIHPWDAEILLPQADTLLEQLSAITASAIGEIGLDYAVEVDRAVQTTIFERQVQIAVQRTLPAIVHSVRATDDILGILRSLKLRKAVFHGFTGNCIIAEHIISAGYHISFGRRSFRSPKTIEALRRIPLDRLFFETDDDSMPIEEVYSTAAEIIDSDIELLKETIEQNYKTLLT